MKVRSLLFGSASSVSNAAALSRNRIRPESVVGSIPWARSNPLGPGQNFTHVPHRGVGIGLQESDGLVDDGRGLDLVDIEGRDPIAWSIARQRSNAVRRRRLRPGPDPARLTRSSM